MDVIANTSCNDFEWTSGQRALDLGIATSLAAEDADVSAQSPQGTVSNKGSGAIS
jgi:hypothetical protein